MKVTVIRHKGHAALVEYQEAGKPYRVVIPLADIGPDNIVDDLSLAMGLPYGIPWEDHLKAFYMVEGAALADALRRAGLWTTYDVEQQPGALQAATLDACREIAEAVARTAKAFRNNTGGNNG
jgi:hypothetical protein